MEAPEADDAVEGDQAEEDHHRLQQDEPGLRQHRSVCVKKSSTFWREFQIFQREIRSISRIQRITEVKIGHTPRDILRSIDEVKIGHRDIVAG